jgi:DNA-binding response OmpR family regulator/DNA-binding transcriptional LysR family regulator
MRIAILEDDPDQLALLRRWITDDGHDVHAYVSGREAMKMAGRESFDLFMLDWQVPDVTGAEVLMWVRANVSKSVPVLFVTVRDSEQDIVFALEHGADDYMVKPVRRQELLARVHALLRRAYPSEEKKLLAFPPFEIDTQRNEVRKDGARVDLTPKEFELTVTLFRNIGRLMSRGHLQETVWGRSGDLATRTVDTHVSQVRKKLDLRRSRGTAWCPSTTTATASRRSPRRRKNKGDPDGAALRAPVPEEEEEATGAAMQQYQPLTGIARPGILLKTLLHTMQKWPIRSVRMAVFARVVATGSLSAAARELSLSPAMVSRRLAALEARLGVRLVNRTTRSLHLTDEGASYYESCARVLSEIEQANASVSAGRREPQGTLRVALPAAFGNQYVAPLVPQFATLYPAVQLALSLSDRSVNLVEDGFDLAVRIAALADSSLAARKLAPNRRVVCASPEYLRHHGAPTSPAELAQHNCLLASDFGGTWEYRDTGGKAWLGSGERPLCVRQLGGAARVGARRPGHRAQVDVGRAPPPLERRAGFATSGL